MILTTFLDATHAEHINTIKERAYIGEERGFLIPGTLGMGLVEGFEAMTLTLAEPKLRANLELELKQICDGLKNPKDVLRNQIALYKDAYRVMTEKIRALDEALSRRLQSSAVEVSNAAVVESTVERVTTCNKCKTNNIVLKKKKNGIGYFLTCDGYPVCQNTVWLPEELESIEMLDTKCEKCGNIRNKMRFKLSSALMRLMGASERNYTSCIFCDQSLTRALNLNIEPLTRTYVNTPIHDPPPSNATTRPTNNRTQQPQRPNGAPAPTSLGWNNNPPPRSNHSGGGQQGQQYKPIKCTKCGKMTKVLTTKKDGPNKNRKFHLCDTCGFVKFADEVTQADQARGSSTGTTTTTTTTTSNFYFYPIILHLLIIFLYTANKRRCGICRAEGHTRNRCPERENFS